MKVISTANPSNGAGTPTNLQLFYMDVTSYLTSAGSNSTSISILKVTDTFRGRIAKLIYLSSPENLTFSIFS
jgi:hypothetical protein